jgi:hypothetical protein
MADHGRSVTVVERKVEFGDGHVGVATCAAASA